MSDIDWANIVDIFAREYGWTIEDIKKLNLYQVVSLIKLIRKRYDSNNGELNTNYIDNSSKELTMADFKAMGGKERIREDGRKEIVI